MAFGRLKKSQGDCCTANEGKCWDMSQRVGRCHSTETLKAPARTMDVIPVAMGLVGSQQRGDVVGLMLLMITVTLWKEQIMRGRDRKDEQSVRRSRETKSRLPWWFGWAVLVAGRA